MVFPQDPNCYVFLFQEGVIIYWNFTDSNIKKMMQYFNFFIESRIRPIHEHYIYLEKYLHEQDNSFFARHIIQDAIVFLNSTQIEEKLCISFAFLLSMNLKFIENKLSEFVDEIDEAHSFQLRSMLNSFKSKRFI